VATTIAASRCNSNALENFRAIGVLRCVSNRSIAALQHGKCCLLAYL
jgi:hypothetical protein